MRFKRLYIILMSLHVFVFCFFVIIYFIPALLIFYVDAGMEDFIVLCEGFALTGN